jgi:hypothetical protein
MKNLNPRLSLLNKYSSKIGKDDATVETIKNLIESVDFIGQALADTTS